MASTPSDIAPPPYFELDSQYESYDIKEENSNIPQTTSPLQNPIVIPQITNGVGLPFSRAYSPALQSCGISSDQFIQFIDNLNTVYTSKSSVQALGVASTIIDSFHLAPFRLLGSGINAIAKGVANSNEFKQFLNKSNEELFKPKNLKVMVCSTQELAYVVNLSPSEVITLSNIVEYSLHQRMSNLNGYISPLDFSQSTSQDSLPTACKTQVMLKEHQHQRQLTHCAWSHCGRSRRGREIRRFERDMGRFQGANAVSQEREMRRLQDDMFRLEMQSVGGSRCRARKMQNRQTTVREELQWLVVVNL